MQFVLYSLLKPHPGEVDYYNSLPNVDVQLFSEVGSAVGEDERKPKKEAEKLAKMVKALLFFMIMSRRLTLLVIQNFCWLLVRHTFFQRWNLIFSILENLTSIF